MEDISAALELPNAPPGVEPSDRIALQPRELLPVRFVVQAGAWLEVDDMAQERHRGPPVAADPDFPRDAQWIELVRGDSMDQVYPPNSWVHVVDAIAIGYAPQNEDFVVVQRTRQQGGLIERSLKQIVRRGRKTELWPRSNNPKWKSPLSLGESADDETTVEISALVIGSYFMRRQAKY